MNVLYGSYFSESDILAVIPDHIKAHILLKNKSADIPICSLLNDLIKETNLVVKIVFYFDTKIYIIGREWDSIGDKESGGHFKKMVQLAIKKIFRKEIFCRTIGLLEGHSQYIEED